MDNTQTRLSGLIAKTFWPVWRDMREGLHREYWLSGGRGSGKSSFAAIALVLLLLRDRRKNALVYRKVGATLRESVYAQVCWAIDRLGLGALFTQSLSPLEIRYTPTGQRILFRGLDDPAKSKSIKLRDGYFGVLWIEEASELGGIEAIRTVMLSALRGGEGAATILSYNPPISARAWINMEALKPDAARLYHHSSYLDLPKSWLGEGFIEQANTLRSQDERAYEHVFLGKATGAGGQVFGNLRIEPMPPKERAAYDTILWGLDFGFASDPDALVAAGYDKKRRRLAIFEERVSKGLKVDELVTTVKQALCLLGVTGRDTVITCDSADPRMIAELRSRGLLAVAAKKGAGSVEHGIRWLQSLSELWIDPARCPFAAREFSTCEYRRVENEYLPQIEDRDNHTIDALRYATERLATQRTAIIQG